MTTEISHINVQYSKTIGRGEQFGPGFTYPIYVARGKEGIMYVLCRGTEFRPEGVRVVVCTTDEEYVSVFARGIDYQGPHAHNMDDGSLVWPTSIALDSQENLYISDEWLNRISMFSKDGDFLGKWEERAGSGDGELDRPSGMVFDADDNGATPVEYVLVGLASCLSAGIASVAQIRDIQLRSVEAKLEGSMDILGILGADPEVRNGFEDIKVTFDIDADASQEDVEALVAQSQKRSAVFDILTNPTSVSVDVNS